MGGKFSVKQVLKKQWPYSRNKYFHKGNYKIINQSTVWLNAWLFNTKVTTSAYLRVPYPLWVSVDQGSLPPVSLSGSPLPVGGNQPERRTQR